MKDVIAMAFSILRAKHQVDLLAMEVLNDLLDLAFVLAPP